MKPRLAFLAALAACGGGSSSPSGDDVMDDAAEPGGGDTTTPFPIDGVALAGAPATYKGLPLGLTDNGAPTITPVRGVIGVVCVGMSNATQECSHYIGQLKTSLVGQFAANVRVVDCAVGGMAVEAWNDPANDAMLWDACVQQKIVNANLAADQIRVVYHKAADALTTGPNNTAKPPYPDPASDYFVFDAGLTTFAGRLAQKLPAVQAVYTSSRSYGGFAGNQAARGEPLSYEEGHALNQWLASHEMVGNVWYGWGPYLWAPDCATGKNGSGTCYERADYQSDGVHPSTGARDKIAALIHARLLRESWYKP